MMSNVVEDDVKDTKEENTSTVLPGQKLKRARENRNLGQEDIAKELKLDLRFVKALEEGRFNELPQPVYTAGYVRAYSKLVGLLPDEIVSEYSAYQKASVKTNTKSDQEKEPIPSHYRAVQTDLPKSFSIGHSQSDDKRKLNLLVSILAIVVVFAIIWHLSNKSTDEPLLDSMIQGGAQEGVTSGSESSDAEGDKKVIDLQLPKPAPNAGGEESAGEKEQIQSEQKVELNQQIDTEDKKIAGELAQNAENLTELSIHYSENSWVDIRDATGKAIIRKLGIAGRSNTVSGIAPFEVLLGYSPGVSIEYDGKPYDLSDYNDQRVARFVLNNDGGVEKMRSHSINIPGSKIERSEPFAVDE